MSDIKARFHGHPDGVDLTVPVATEGEPPRHINVAHGGELPTEIDGHKVPASFRDSLLDQSDNWSKVSRSAAKPKPKPEPEPAVTETTAPTGEEGDR